MERTLADIVAEIEEAWKPGPRRTRAQKFIDAMKGKTFENEYGAVRHFILMSMQWEGQKAQEIKKELMWRVRNVEKRRENKLKTTIKNTGLTKDQIHGRTQAEWYENYIDEQNRIKYDWDKKRS